MSISLKGPNQKYISHRRGCCLPHRLEPDPGVRHRHGQRRQRLLRLPGQPLEQVDGDGAHQRDADQREKILLSLSLSLSLSK